MFYLLSRDNYLLLSFSDCDAIGNANSGDQGKNMLSLNNIKITVRDEQVLQLLIQGCSNKEIAAQLNISPRTVKQHLRTLFLRAGIRDGRKRVKLATAMFVKEQMKSCTPVNG
jgi:DNA-binding NarL/FixJ family response regulator